MNSIISSSSLCDRGPFHIGLAVNSCTGTSIGRQTNNQERVHAGNPHVGRRATHVLGVVVVYLRGASGNTLYWVLLLV
jgi:hypothetical protein